MIKYNLKKTLYLFVVFTVLVLPILAKNPVINLNKGKHAINGYDPVAYFTVKKAQKGLIKYAYLWRGATWLFANKKHLHLFKKNPKKYSPQYGGYCAFAVSRGFSQLVEPKTSWTIYKGRLYLNYNKKIYNKWSSNRSAYIKKADSIWPKSLEKDPPS